MRGWTVLGPDAAAQVAGRIRNRAQRCFQFMKVNGSPFVMDEDSKMFTNLLLAAGARPDGDEVAQAMVEFKFVANDALMENGAALAVQSQWRRKRMSDHFQKMRWCVFSPGQ